MAKVEDGPNDRFEILFAELRQVNGILTRKMGTILSIPQAGKEEASSAKQKTIKAKSSMMALSA